MPRQRWIEEVSDALAMLFPVRCAGCGARDRGICAECRAALQPGSTTFETLADDIALVTAAEYDDRMRRIVQAFKERSRVDASSVLAPLLRQSIAALVHRQWADAAEGGMLLVPVPSTRAATARRGYDHLQVLAQRALPRAHTASVLRPVRQLRDQSQLDRTERQRNLDHALVAHPMVARRRCIVIDDLVTTGATAREAVRALRDAGAEPLGVAAIARVQRQHG